MPYYRTAGGIVVQGDSVQGIRGLLNSGERELLEKGDAYRLTRSLCERMSIPIEILGLAVIVLCSIQKGEESRVLVVGQCSKCRKHPVVAGEYVCYACAISIG